MGFLIHSALLRSVYLLFLLAGLMLAAAGAHFASADWRSYAARQRAELARQDGVYASENDFASIASDVRRALEIAPDDAISASFLADLYLRIPPIWVGTEDEYDAATRNWAQKAVSLSPADPYAWFDLAVADQIDHPPTVLGIDALRMSVKEGAMEGALVFPRLSYCAVNWDDLPPDARKECAVQFSLGAAWRPRALARLLQGDAKKSAGYQRILAASERDPAVEDLEHLIGGDQR